MPPETYCPSCGASLSPRNRPGGEPREDRLNKVTLSVVIPVYNEAATIERVLEEVGAAPYEKEIIVVDDASEDGTGELLERYRVHHPALRYLRHDRNRGKGAALQTGFAQVSGDIVIIQDADLEYDPGEYPRLLAPVLEGRADVVFGSRFLGEPHRVLLYWHYLANKFLTALSNLFTNINLTDMTTCYKVFRSEVLREVRFRSNRFGFEPEFVAKVAKKKYRIYEVGIAYHGRDYSEGKKIRLKDAFVMLWAIFRYNVFR